jgi:hypothetical protein
MKPMPRIPPGFLAALARSWFGLALVVLVLLAIPGFVVFALDIFGAQGRVNGWLQENLHLSYHLPLAWWLGLILFLVPLAVVLLYFLKLKRKPLSVPSTFLWRKSIEDLHVNALFQWLRRNILLLLQLLALLFLVYAFMDIRLHGRTRDSRHYILMIDNSASMSATDVAPSRLHWARAEALKEIDAASDSDYGMVIVFNASAEILQSYTNNRGQLRSAIERIEQTERPTRIEEALTLADSLANPIRSGDDASVRPADSEAGKERTFISAEGVVTDVHLYSDGRFPDMPEFSLGNLNISFHAAGKPGPENVNNAGLVSFNALRDDADPTKLQVFARALNFCNRPVESKIVLEVRVQGALKAIKEKALALPARQVQTLADAQHEEPQVRDTPGEAVATFELGDLDDRASVVLHARLAGSKDDFPLDDEAWLVVGLVRKARILVVGGSNPVLKAFFDDQATREVATVTTMSPGDLATDRYRKPALNGDFDLVIFDRCAPAREDDMPRGNTFFIGAPPPPWTGDQTEKISNPQIKGWMGKHSVLRYLAALQDVGIADAFKMKNLPPRTPRLIEIEQNNAILLTLNRQAFTDLVMTFPIITDQGQWNTNWPLLPSFPLFMRNIIYALGNISDGTGEETIQPGQVMTLHPDAAVPQIQVTDPAGKAETLARGSRSDFTYGQTNRVGVYDVAWQGGGQRSFAVNLLDAEESNLEPRNIIRIGARAVASGQERQQPRELWKWLALAALCLLLTEWYIYNRRVYV